jgi:hypothetical protein
LSESKWGKYVITEPKFVTDLAFHDFKDVSGFTFPDEVYIDKDLVPEANTWLDHKNLRDLGGVVEWGMGAGEEAETFTLTSTTAIYVPPNLPHGPLVYKSVDRPILNIAIGLQTGDYS